MGRAPRGVPEFGTCRVEPLLATGRKRGKVRHSARRGFSGPGEVLSFATCPQLCVLDTPPLPSKGSRDQPWEPRVPAPPATLGCWLSRNHVSWELLFLFLSFFAFFFFPLWVRATCYRCASSGRRQAPPVAGPYRP